MNGCCDLHPEPPEDMSNVEKVEYWNAAHKYHSEEAVKYANKAARYSTIATVLILISATLMTVSVILSLL